MTVPKLDRAEGLPSGDPRGKVSRPQNLPKPKQPWRKQGAHCFNCVSCRPLYNKPAMGMYVIWCEFHQDSRLSFSCCQEWEKRKTER